MTSSLKKREKSKLYSEDFFFLEKHNATPAFHLLVSTNTLMSKLRDGFIILINDRSNKHIPRIE